MRHLLLTVLLALAGCGATSKVKEKDSAALGSVAELRSLFKTHTAELAAAADPASGFPSAEDCDATLWAGEAAYAGLTVHLEAAETAPGVVTRRPATSGPCYPDHSASSTSRDMLLGYVLGKWAQRDGAALQRLADYGEAHSWTMGEGDASRVQLSADGQGLLGRAIEALTAGADKRSYRSIPSVCFPVSADYERHLQSVSVLLQGEVADVLEGEAKALTMDINGTCMERLQANAAADPDDALGLAILGVYTGDMAPAATLLTDASYAPPSYVRGAGTYTLVHWLIAATVVLKRFPEDGT